MPFPSSFVTDPGKVGAGEEYNPSANTILAYLDFENELVVGRFAKLEAGQLDNIDGSADPVVAGVVLRNIASTIEQATSGLEVIETAIYSKVSAIRQGLVSVEVKADETPEKFAKVYISNLGDANDGKAITAESGLDAHSSFIEEIDTDVWMILVDLPAEKAVVVDPGDAGAIPAANSGSIAITTAAAETRTLADPVAVGQLLSMSFDVDGGNCVITSASAVNQTGNNTLTMADAGDFIKLEAVQVAGVPKWRISANDGVALSTV